MSDSINDKNDYGNIPSYADPASLPFIYLNEKYYGATLGLSRSFELKTV